MRILGVTLLCLAGLSFLPLSPVWAASANLYYSDGPWSGRVIDSETKEPIEGAVVVAAWQKVYRTPAGENSYFYDAVEVLTDRDGRFRIPRFSALNILPIIRYIEGPKFTIFKPGYTGFPGPAYIYFHKYFPKSPLRVDTDTLANLFKKGVVVDLFKLKTKEERLEVLPSISSPFLNHNERKKNYIILINKERQWLGLEAETGGIK